MYLILAASALFLFVLYLCFKKHALDEIPGPRRYPIVGNCLQLRDETLHLTLRDWSLKYGPVFKYHVLDMPVLVVSGYEALREILLTRGKDFGGRVMDSAMKKVYLGRGVLNSDVGHYLSINRKAIHRSLKLYGNGQKHFEDNVAQVLASLVQTFEDQNQAAFDCCDIVSDTLAVFMCSLVAGREIEKTSRAIPHLRRVSNFVTSTPNWSISPYVIFLNKFPWTRLFYSRPVDKQERSQRIFTNFWNDFVFPLRDTEEFKEGHGLLASLCKMQATEKDDNITDYDIGTMLRNIVIAGSMTTTSTLYALLSVFLHYPRVQEKAAEEVITNVGAKTKVGLEHKNQLPYTRAVILEVLRFASNSPHSILHQAMVDTQVQGYHVPKGTVVVPANYIHHTNPKEWDEPFLFNPDRFLDDQGDLLPADHPTRKRMLAFGAGPRSCLGEVFALNRLLLLVASLLQKFSFLPPEGEPLVSCDPRDWSCALLFMPNRFHMRAIPRIS